MRNAGTAVLRDKKRQRPTFLTEPATAGTITRIRTPHKHRHPQTCQCARDTLAVASSHPCLQWIKRLLIQRSVCGTVCNNTMTMFRRKKKKAQKQVVFSLDISAVSAWTTRDLEGHIWSPVPKSKYNSWSPFKTPRNRPLVNRLAPLCPGMYE